MPAWLRFWLIIAAIASGAVLLWIGLTVTALLLAVAFLPFWLWSLVAGRRSNAASAVIEGEYRVEEPAALESSKGPPQRDPRSDSDRSNPS